MQYLKFRFYFIFFFSISVCYGQEINTSSVSRNINGDGYFRLNYENDFFTATDFYYSQGIGLELVHPILRKIIPLKMLLHLDSGEIKYGLSLEHDAYTPTSIRHEEILQNDHPYAATLMLRMFTISTNNEKKKRITSGITLGVIGPSAGGEEMQKGIHDALDNITPLGWQNQVSNDVVLNYRFHYERKLLSVKNYFLLNGNATINAGTLKDNAGAGLSIMIGSFQSPFAITNDDSHKHRNFQIYMYVNPEVKCIGYDAVLQGGLFNRDSPYVISADKISRITFQGDAGVVINIKQIYLEYFQSYLTKEFTEGKEHRWGGIRIGTAF
ncbi:MAG: lipid A deacylase LpxR family protein [Bacteroidota bacterium]